MKYIGLSGLVVTFFLLAACSAPAPAATGTLEAEANYWQQQGSVAGTGRNVSLMSDGTSNTIAFSEYDSLNYGISVKRWNGAAWTDLASYLSGSSYGASYANEPSLALDSSGNPTVAWKQGNTGSSIYMQQFTSSS
jgi:hypothetical protein